MVNPKHLTVNSGERQAFFGSHLFYSSNAGFYGCRAPVLHLRAPALLTFNVPVTGREKVVVFLSNLFKLAGELRGLTKTVEMNGLFATATVRDVVPEGYAGKVVTAVSARRRRLDRPHLFRHGVAQAFES